MLALALATTLQITGNAANKFDVRFGCQLTGRMLFAASVDPNVCSNRMHDGSVQHLTEAAVDQTQQVPVFVVNARPFRCVQMQRLLNHTGMSSYVVAGSSIHNRFLQHLHDEGLIDEPNEESKRYIAVWRSHRAVWEHVQELGLAQALILEDDVDMERDILQTVNQVVEMSNRLPPRDLLYLGTIMDGLRLTEESFTFDEFHTIRRASTVYGAHAYLVSLRAAQFLLKSMKIRDVMKVNFDASMSWSFFDDDGGPEGKSSLIPLVMRPAVVVQLPNLPGTSDINPYEAVRYYDKLRNSTRQIVMLESMNDMWDKV